MDIDVLVIGGADHPYGRVGFYERKKAAAAGRSGEVGAAPGGLAPPVVRLHAGRPLRCAHLPGAARQLDGRGVRRAGHPVRVAGGLG